MYRCVKLLLIVLLLSFPASVVVEKRWCPVVSSVDRHGFTDFIQRCHTYIKVGDAWVP